MAEVPEAQRTADLVNSWIAKAKATLKDRRPANMVTLRGFAQDPALPKFQDIFKLKPAAVAVYPMYRGVARLVGMDVIPVDHPISNEFQTVADNWDQYDFSLFTSSTQIAVAKMAILRQKWPSSKRWTGHCRFFWISNRMC